VVLKREPLGSLREELLFLGGILFQEGIGEEKLWMKKLVLIVYSTQSSTTRLVQMGMSTARKHKVLHHNRLSQFFLFTGWSH